MAPADFNFDREVLPVVKKLALKWFAGYPDSDDLVCDMLSVAWQFWKRAPHIPPKSHAYYAAKRVRCGRQFSQSSRSIDGSNPDYKPKPQRANGYDLGLVARVGDDPAEIVVVTVDGKSFRANLSTRDRQFFDCFLTGMTTTEVAKQFGVTLGAVSQRRRATVAKWHEYTA